MDHFINQINKCEPVSVGELRSSQEVESTLGVIACCTIERS